MFKGPVGPQSGQTGRSIAEQKNSAEGFNTVPDMPYDTQGGHPITKDMPEQEYKEAELKEASGGALTDQPSPFTLKGA